MGQCMYCEKTAGFLRRKHKKCHQQYLDSKKKILALVRNIGSNCIDIQQLATKIELMAANGFIDRPGLNNLIATGWEQAVETALDDGILTEQEERALNELKNHFSLSQQLLDENGSYSKLIKGAVLRDIMDGNLPEQMHFDGNLPFNLQKTEKIVWVFKNVNYYEEKTRTRYVGGSQGMSVRVARGLYYRVGAFKGERVQTSETIHADTGLLGITNKHIYFAGTSKRFRIAFNKIVTFEPFSDGIGVQKDAQTAKPQSFQTGDGWFTYNLITNLAQM